MKVMTTTIISTKVQDDKLKSLAEKRGFFDFRTIGFLKVITDYTLIKVLLAE